MSHPANDDFDQFIEDASDWAHQSELERRQEAEDIEREYGDFLRKSREGRPWYYIVDQDEKWIARVTRRGK